MKKSPIAMMRDRFGEDRKSAKAKLVEAVRSAAGDLWVDRVNEGKGLERVATQKLLRLEQAFTAIRKEVGSRSGLIDALLKAESSTKDGDRRASLENASALQIWDRLKSVRRAQESSQA